MRIGVVGAGIGGLSAAWGLARAGHGVVVFEKERIGAGASGLALGGLVPFGLHVRGRLARVQRESVAEWVGFAEEIGAAAGGRVEEFYRVWPGGVAQVRVPEVLRVMADGLRRLGVEIIEGREVADWAGLLAEFDGVVLAAGWGNAALGVEGLGISAGQALRVRAKGEVGPGRYVDGMYILPGWNGEVLLGSASRDMAGPGDGSVDEDVTARMLAKAAALEPRLAGAEVKEAWVGYRPQRLDGLLPLLRPVSDKVVAVTGLGKLGYCLAPALAEGAANCVGGGFAAGQMGENA